MLQVRPVAASPGVFYVFRDDAHRETFVASRFRQQVIRPYERKSDRLFDSHRELLQELQDFVTQRGRLPAETEFGSISALRANFGTVRQAFQVIRRVTGSEPWKELTTRRTEDLNVYLALSRLSGRSRWSALSEELQGDIRAFFSTYRQACTIADKLLFSAGDTNAVEEACRQSPIGKLTQNALYVHRSAIDALFPILRVYEGCARALVGEVEGANIIKLSRETPKVSYLSYPAFDQEPHPSLAQSIIVYPGQLKVFHRDYSKSANPPILHRKEDFLTPDHPFREKFRRLTEQEERAGLYKGPETIGTKEGWEALLASREFRLRGHRLVSLRQKT